jgi:hypothetical protein
MHDDYAQAHNENTLVLNACLTENGNIVNKIPLLLKWDDVRVILKSRNDGLHNLSRQYISTKIT